MRVNTHFLCQNYMFPNYENYNFSYYNNLSTFCVNPITHYLPKNQISEF